MPPQRMTATSTPWLTSPSAMSASGNECAHTFENGEKNSTFTRLEARQRDARSALAYPGRVNDDVRLTDAALGDSTDVFTWRNDPATRAASVTQDEVSLRRPRPVVRRDAHQRRPHRIHRAPRRFGDRTVPVRCRRGLRRSRDQPGNPEFRGRGLARPILAGSIASFVRRIPRCV